MSDKPTTGEWTKENMAGKWSRGEKWIIAEHNASLATERERVKGLADEWWGMALAAEVKRANDSIEENVRLLNRLAEERENAEKAAARAELAQIQQLAVERKDHTERMKSVQDFYSRQLAAEREIKSAEKKILLDEIAKNQQLREQIADERAKPKTTEYAQGWDDHVLAAKSQRETLEEQLAIAVDALKFISEQGEEGTSLKSMADAALEKIGGK